MFRGTGTRMLGSECGFTEYFRSTMCCSIRVDENMFGNNRDRNILKEMLGKIF